MPKSTTTKTKTSAVKKGSSKIDHSGEVNAAIAMAIHLYLNELHDVESGIVTIKRVNKMYSPWSSKFYCMRNL